MDPILLAGFPLGSSLGLVTAFEWLGLPYRVARVDMPREMETPEFGRVNGRRETPVLIQSDGTVLTESVAIALWLEAQDRTQRISFAAGSPERHRMHQLMGFINSSFTGAFTPLWVAFEAPDADEATREAWRKLGRTLVARRHAQLEEMLGDTPYMLGDRPTLADALFLGVGRWAVFHQAIDLSAYPKVLALRTRLENDAAARVALQVEDGVGDAGGKLIPLAEALAAART